MSEDNLETSRHDRAVKLVRHGRDVKQRRHGRAAKHEGGTMKLRQIRINNPIDFIHDIYAVPSLELCVSDGLQAAITASAE